MKNNICIITGKPGSGKTTFIRKLLKLLQDAGLAYAGFYADGYWQDGLRSGFDIVEVNELQRECLCNTTAEEGDLQYRRFYFKQRGLALGSEILRKAEGNEKIVFIDEIGGFEMEGQGWAGAIEKLQQKPPGLMIWTVRENLVDEICRKFGIMPQAIWNIDEAKAKEITAEIKTLLYKT